MTKQSPLLVSSRDTAAALFMVPVIETALDRHEVNLHVVAQGLAAPILRQKLAGRVGIIEIPDLNDLDKLTGIADELLRSIRPKAILTGLSSPGQTGIDEVLVRRALDHNVLCIATIQDFWGACNFYEDARPHCLFVQDEFAKKMTEQAHDVSCSVVGSPRHDRYANLSPFALKCKFRNSLRVDDEQVLVFCSQSLHSVQGYIQHLEALSSAVHALKGRRWRFLYRPHPRETPDEVCTTLAHLNSDTKSFVLAPPCTVEEAICGSDVIVSMFSNCLYDAAYLNRVSYRPVTLPISAILSNDLNHNLDKHHRISVDALPYDLLGIPKLKCGDGNLNDLLDGENLSSNMELAWKQASLVLPKPGSASERIVDFVTNAVPGIQR